MSEHGPGVIEFFVYFIVKKVFENAWLMMSGIFISYVLYLILESSLIGKECYH